MNDPYWDWKAEAAIRGSSSVEHLEASWGKTLCLDKLNHKFHFIISDYMDWF